MQAIERYGVVALLLLIATVVAVLVWDQDADGPSDEVAAAGRDRAPAATAREPVGDPVPGRTGRRLQLTGRAERKPLSRAALEPEAGPPEAGLVVPEEDVLRDEPTWTPPPQAYQPTVRASVPEPTVREAVREPRPEPRQPAPSERRSAPAGSRSYVIRKGDTLGEISLAELGTSKRWKEILALNPGLDEKRLLVGREILLPAASGGAGPPAARPAAPERPPAAGPSYRVQKGDSLWKIALRSLGDGERWREIAALNPKIDPDRLHVGQALVLPAGSHTASEPVVASNTGSSPAGRVR